MTRKAYLLLFVSIAILVGFVIFAPGQIASLTGIIDNFKNTNEVQGEEDKTPPAPPSIDVLPKFVKQDEVTVSGRAEIDSTLKVYIDEAVVKEVLVDNSSTFSFKLSLGEGKNTIWGTMTDSSGNTSEKSSTQIVDYDIKPPEFLVVKPADGETFFSEDKTVTIEGTAEPEVKLMVNNRLVIIEQNGNWELKYTLSDGQNTLLFVATDPAENKSEKTITVSYVP